MLIVSRKCPIFHYNSKNTSNYGVSNHLVTIFLEIFSLISNWYKLFGDAVPWIIIITPLNVKNVPEASILNNLYSPKVCRYMSFKHLPYVKYVIII